MRSFLEDLRMVVLTIVSAVLVIVAICIVDDMSWQQILALFVILIISCVFGQPMIARREKRKHETGKAYRSK